MKEKMQVIKPNTFNSAPATIATTPKMIVRATPVAKMLDNDFLYALSI